MQSSPLPIFALDARGTVHVWNHASEALFGWPAAEVVGGPVPFLDSPDELDALTAEIASRLPAGPALYPADDLTDRDERFLAAEYLREKIFRQLGDELPYAAAVAIDTFAHEADLRRIHATVFVEKASQRAILLGEGGSRMKAIATGARRDMEHLFGGKVFLEVWVRVKPGWANDERMLTQLGY